MATEQAFEVDVRDVEYQNQDGKAWLARVYQPKGDGPFPTMVDVHGGAWVNGDRTNDTSMDTALAARGIVVAALDFRQPPEAGYPASMCDVNLGVRWLKANASQFNGTNLLKSGDDFNVLSSLNRNTSGVSSSEIQVARSSLEVNSGNDPFASVTLGTGASFVEADGAYQTQIFPTGTGSASEDTVVFTFDNASFANDANSVKAGDTINLSIGDTAISYTITEADLSADEKIPRSDAQLIIAARLTAIAEAVAERAEVGKVGNPLALGHQRPGIGDRQPGDACGDDFGRGGVDVHRRALVEDISCSFTCRVHPGRRVARAPPRAGRAGPRGR